MKPKLVILSPGFPENEQDTTCLPAMQQFVLACRDLLGSERLQVISLQYPFKAGSYSWNGINVMAFGGRNRRSIFRIFTWIKAYRFILQLHKRSVIKGMISLWYTEAAVIAKYLQRFKGIKCITWLQGQDAKAGNPYPRWFPLKAGQIVAISDFLSDEFEKNHQVRPFLTVNNGVDPRIFPDLNSGKRTIDVFAAGSLVAVKNYPFLLDLISKLKPVFPNLSVKIAGEGPLKEALAQLIKDKGLSNNVELLGEVQHAKVLQLMNNSKVLLHTSSYEGNSTVIIEALYSGCQVVSTLGLSNVSVPNLFVSVDQNVLAQKVIQILNENPPSRPVTFNLMRSSAEKLVALFDLSDDV